ncbi:hypothetical protein AOQ84DRAFT_3271 [Glonium stellatum]|uniref:Rhodopsin domain-containing protein n=1 Tax=Glonium stellatum TaxID=574774 RepID=A0A8E2F4Z8_9PEZI|nr:hypothetical protein AOQ84DRAFT_3271 [Glonium stellatum]
MGGDPHIPISATLKWPTPNYTDPVRRTWFPAYGITLELFTTTVLGARIWSRFRRAAGPPGVDDALIIISWIFATLFTSLCVLGTERYGFDRHIWDVKATLLVGSAKIRWLSEGAFLISTCLTKVSVLLFYRRLNAESYSRTWKRITYTAITFTAVYLFAFLLDLVLICSPTDAYWESFDLNYKSNYHCSSEHVTNPLVGAFGVITDFYTVLLPALWFWRIQMPKRQKIGLYIIFAFGFLVVGAGIARSVWLARLANSTVGDTTWLGFDVFCWSQLECQFAIICASAPSLKVFISKYLSGPLSKVYQSSKKLSDSMSSSRSATSMSDRLRRSFQRPNNLRPLVISDPQVVEIPDWVAQAYDPPRQISSPKDNLDVYDRYLAGQYGPPPPPKDHKYILDQYRRDYV